MPRVEVRLKRAYGIAERPAGKRRDRRDRQGRADPARAHRARMPRARTARGCPRHGKDVLARSIAAQHRGNDRLAHPMHAGLAADRRDGADGIRPTGAGVSLSAGPVFANVLLVDEINRAMPKTQSALLEAMAERQVTVDGVTHGSPTPFLLLATENPIEQKGTFPLPEAQLDRFFLRTALGYPTPTRGSGSSRPARRAPARVARAGRRRATT